jgi:hypothetical protein
MEMGVGQMTRIRLIIVALLFTQLFWTSYGVADVTSPTERSLLEISKVGLDRKVFNPSKGETVTLSFETNRTADMQAIIYDSLGQQVTSISRSKLEQGRHDFTWNGRRLDGKFVQGRVFLYVIEATTTSGERAIHNPAQKTGGLLVKPHTYTFDRSTGKIEYVLPKACMIRLRAGLKEGMLARTIFDWEPRTAGRHNENWDGKGVSGLISLSNHPDLDLNLTCYTLPSNTIIATGDVKPLEPERKHKNRKIKEKYDPWARKDKYLHYQHDPYLCREPNFALSFPESTRLDTEGVPVVSGRVPVRIELGSRDTKHLIDRRFEIIIYIDGTYFFEMEEGTTPFTYYWDTKAFAKGPHIVTVNVMSWDDHVGVVSKKIIIGKD